MTSEDNIDNATAEPRNNKIRREDKFRATSSTNSTNLIEEAIKKLIETKNIVNKPTIQGMEMF